MSEPSTWTLVRLGARTLRGTNRRRLAALVLAVVGIAACTWAAAFTFGIGAALEGFAERDAQRTPDGTASAGADDARFATDGLAWRGEAIAQFVVSIPGRAPATPPGVDRWPAPGEAVVSAAIAERLRSDHALRTLIDARVIGTISDEGLRFPGELAVWRGVDHIDDNLSDTTDSGPFTSIGVSVWRVQGFDQESLSGIRMFVLISTLLPALALASAGLRLDARNRYRRIRAMRIVGLRAREVGRIDAIEGAGVLALGFLVGLAAYELGNLALANSGLLGFRWFSEDSALTTQTVLIVGGIVAVMGGVVIRFRNRRAYANALGVKPQLPRRRRLIARLLPLPLLVGLSGLLGYSVLAATRDAGDLSMLRYDDAVVVSTALVAVGMLASLPAVTRAISRRAARKARTPGARLGHARLAYDAGPTLGLIGGVGLILLAFFTSVGYSQSVRSLDMQLPGRPVVEVEGGLSSPHREAPLRANKSILAILAEKRLPVPTSDAEANAWLEEVLAGTCADLRVLVASPGMRCAPGQAFAVHRGVNDRLPEGAPPPGRLTLKVDGNKTLPVELMPEPVSIPRVDPQALPNGTLLVAEKEVDLTSQNRLYFVIDRDGDAWGAYAQLLNATSGQFSAGFYTSAFDEQANHVTGLIVFCFATATLLLFFVVLLTMVDRSVERRRSDTALLALGVPAKTIGAAHRAEVSHPVLLGLLLAVVCGIISGITWQLASGLMEMPDIGNYALLTGLAVALWLFAMATSRWVATRRIDVAEIRRD